MTDKEFHDEIDIYTWNLRIKLEVRKICDKLGISDIEK